MKQSIRLSAALIYLTMPVCWGQMSVQLSTGLGLSRRPDVMLSAPFYGSAAVSVPVKRHWRVIGEGGTVSFRSTEYPDYKFGFILAIRARFQHNYVGLRIGRNLLRHGSTHQLIVSGGADYLAIVEPVFSHTSGLFAGPKLDYTLNPYLNVPFQIDYKSGLATVGSVGLLLSIRYNVNPYHSFPVANGGVFIPFFKRR